MYIFISYSRKNVDVANYIADHLRKHAADVFIDYEILKGGENFPERLALEIEKSDAVIFLLSQESAASRWVRAEIQRAFNLDKLIIPVSLDSTAVPHAMFFLDGIDRIDFTGFSTNEHVESALLKLARSLGLSQVTPPILPQMSFSPSHSDILLVETQNTSPISKRPIVDIMPPTNLADGIRPIEWCYIPSGKVILKDASIDGGTIGGEYTIDAFFMAKYPITNAQYQVFAAAKDGYVDPQWWDYSDDAKKWRKANPKSEDTGFPGDDLPRTNASWYDAIAFCRWLTAKSASVGAHRDAPSGITLPTEQQWQRAAIGDTGWAYPWGNDFDKNRCNTRESGIGNPTSVTQYPNGASPYGVIDMSGNVWEWCLTQWGTDISNNDGNNTRVLRGGSWGFIDSYARAFGRFRNLPSVRFNVVGFRCVRPL